MTDEKNEKTKKIGEIGQLEINSAMIARYNDESIKKIYELCK